MITLERNINKPPSVPPPDYVFWGFYEREFTLPAEEFPTEHLVGRVALEDCVANAEVQAEQGVALSDAEQALLRLADEYLFDVYTEE